METPITRIAHEEFEHRVAAETDYHTYLSAHRELARVLYVDDVPLAHYAATSKNDNLMVAIIQTDKRLLCTAYGPEKQTSAHIAAVKGWHWGVHFLLSNCPELDVQEDFAGKTPVDFVMDSGNSKLLSTIVRAKVNIGTGTSIRITKKFVKWRMHEDLAFVLSENPDLIFTKITPKGDTVLHLLCREGDEKGVEMFLRMDANKQSLDAVNYSGNTPLTIAAQHSLDISRLLLDAGASIAFVHAGVEVNALGVAVAFDCCAIAREILDKDESLARNPYKGDYPLNLARSPKMLDLLMSRGAKVSDVMGNSDTVLHELTYPGESIESFATVLKHVAQGSADLNSKSMSIGDTAMHKAVRSDNIAAVSLLLKHGASTLVLNNNGESVMLLAMRYDRKMIADLLLRVQTDLSFETQVGFHIHPGQRPLKVRLSDEMYRILSTHGFAEHVIGLHREHDIPFDRRPRRIRIIVGVERPVTEEEEDSIMEVTYKIFFAQSLVARLLYELDIHPFVANGRHQTCVRRLFN